MDNSYPPNADATQAGLLSNVAQTIDGAKRGAPHVLTSASAHIAVDLAVGNNFAHTTTENTMLDNPTNFVAGQHGSIELIQGATPRTLTFGTNWKFPGGTAPSLTATAGARDVLVYNTLPSNVIAAALLKDVK